MIPQFIFKKVDKIFIFILVLVFFAYNLKTISYGLPFFLNADETSFQYSTLNYLKLLTGDFDQFIKGHNPIYASLINMILILKFVFINEMIFNALNFKEIYTKIYFNTELFIFYGRVASLFITSLSIFTMYLIFKKLKINVFIYSILLITFTTSLVIFDISTVNGKNSYYLLIFLVQIYFLIKFLLKIEKFNSKSYLIFGALASIAWGVNYWPALISIYSVFLLHIKKYNFKKIKYLFYFSIIFLVFGPLLNFLPVAMTPFDYITPVEENKKFYLGVFIYEFYNDFISSFKITYSVEKNFILLIILLPFFLFKKEFFYKKEFLLIFFIIFEPIILLGISEKIFPQLRYFAGNISLILILVSIIINQLYINNYKFFVIIFIFANFYFIYDNLSRIIKIDNIVSVNSLFDFKKNLKVDQKKVLYLANLQFQESLKQNLLYIELYNNGIIKKSNKQNYLIERIKTKVDKINNSKKIDLIYNDLKKDLIYYDYSNFEIDDLKLFFDYIKRDFDYLVIEESKADYLSSDPIRKKINVYVKENFSLEFTQFENEKIYFRSKRHVIEFFANSLSRFYYTENVNKDLEKIYGNNYSLYKFN